MTQASSYLLPNSGAYLGLRLMQLLEVGKESNKLSRKNIKFETLLNEYQRRLTEKALDSPEWYPYAKYLKVRLRDGSNISVVFDGPSYLESTIKLIEYGSGGSVANPLMRVSEAEFSSDFDTKRMFAA